MVTATLQADIRRSSLPASRKVLFAALVDLIGGQASARFSVDALARDAGMAVRTVYRALAELEALGLIGRAAEWAEGRRNGVIRSASGFVVHKDKMRLILSASRAALADRLDAAWAKMHLRMIERQLGLARHRSRFQRSAILARLVEGEPSSSLNCDLVDPESAVDLVVTGSVAENRAALAAAYVPVHLRKHR